MRSLQPPHCNHNIATIMSSCHHLISGSIEITSLQLKQTTEIDAHNAINFEQKSCTDLAQRCRLFALNQTSGASHWKRHLWMNKARLSHVYKTITGHREAVMLTELSRFRIILKGQQSHQLSQRILHSIISMHILRSTT